MKIVEAKFEKSKRQQMREIISRVVGQSEKAVFFEMESDYREFCKLARSAGHKPKSRKLSMGGWLVWVN